MHRDPKVDLMARKGTLPPQCMIHTQIAPWPSATVNDGPITLDLCPAAISFWYAMLDLAAPDLTSLRC